MSASSIFRRIAGLVVAAIGAGVAYSAASKSAVLGLVFGALLAAAALFYVARPVPLRSSIVEVIWGFGIVAYAITSPPRPVAAAGSHESGRVAGEIIAFVLGGVMLVHGFYRLSRTGRSEPSADGAPGAKPDGSAAPGESGSDYNATR